MFTKLPKIRKIGSLLFAIDANSNTEINFARKLFQIAASASVHIFLLLVTKNR